MGGYCKFCNRRCFLLRVMLDGRTVLLATCPAGMDHDLAVSGETHETAVNAFLEPEAALRRHQHPAPQGPEVFCGFCRHHMNAHTYSASAEEVPCVGCRGKVCPRPDTCLDCLQPIRQVDGVWVVFATGTSADGLTGCPPDPDANPAGPHRPVVTPANRHRV